MQKWEYLRLSAHYKSENIVDEIQSNGAKVFQDPKGTSLNVYLSNLGKDGWELTSCYQWGTSTSWEIFYFKRPLE